MLYSVTVSIANLKGTISCGKGEVDVGTPFYDLSDREEVLEMLAIALPVAFDKAAVAYTEGRSDNGFEH